MLGPEDPPLPTMIADVLFYSILVWIVLYIVQSLRRQAFSPKLLVASLSLNSFLGVALWVFYFIFTFTMGFQGIGRGYGGSVYVEISKDIGSARTFEPTVSVPLDEVIEYYGDPNYVVFASDSATENPSISLLL